MCGAKLVYMDRFMHFSQKLVGVTLRPVVQIRVPLKVKVAEIVIDTPLNNT